MELLKFFISLQRIKIFICVCNLCEVIFRLFDTVNFTINDQLELVQTGFFCVVDRLGPVPSGPVTVP
jgi:hypothetical protein